MPLYDYRCAQCGREVEVMHGIHETGPDACESCGGSMRKGLSAPAIHFKGSGWAKKDAAAGAKAKAKPKADTKTAGEGGESDSSSGGSESDGGDAAKPSEPKASTAKQDKAATSAGASSD